ncbi:MAG: hypothetical protein JWN78_2905 [Bacteroidota bacterium]|nr:hypothetical protein [Bacteroidota bacterium]
MRYDHRMSEKESIYINFYCCEYSIRMIKCNVQDFLNT